MLILCLRAPADLLWCRRSPWSLSSLTLGLAHELGNIPLSEVLEPHLGDRERFPEIQGNF